MYLIEFGALGIAQLNRLAHAWINRTANCRCYMSRLCQK